MARGTREALLTHVDQALNDLKRANDNIEFMRDTYQPVHPDLANVCQAHLDAIEAIALSLMTFKDEKM